MQVAGDHKVLAANNVADCKQLLRQLGELRPNLPLWRQQRPMLQADEVAAHFDVNDPGAQGIVVLR